MKFLQEFEILQEAQRLSSTKLQENDEMRNTITSSQASSIIIFKEKPYSLLSLPDIVSIKQEISLK